MLGPLAAACISGLAALWLTAAGSKRAALDRGGSCWCPVVAAALAAGTVLAASLTGAQAALVAAVPCAVIAGVDLHCQRAPHEMTAAAAAAVSLAAWPDVLGGSAPGSAVLLPASIALIGVATFLVKDSPSFAVWPLLSYLSLAVLAWRSLGVPALVVPPLAGLVLAALAAGASVVAARAGRTGVGGGDIALIAVTVAAASWPTEVVAGGESWLVAVHQANREWMVFTAAAAVSAVAVAWVLNRRVSGTVPAAPCLAGGMMASAGITVA